MILDAFPAAVQGWQNFYMLTGEAAATLTGLMFIAVTFGSSLVTKETSASARAFLDPTFSHFVQVLITACLLTIPIMNGTILGVLLVAVSVVRIGGLVWVHRHMRAAHRRANDIELSDWLIMIVLPGIFYLLLLTAGASFIRGRAEALSELAIGTVGLLVIGIRGAWELLVWMAVMVTGVRDRPPGAASGVDDSTAPRAH